jgi:DNA-binding NarL/FixJ family response regulator
LTEPIGVLVVDDHRMFTEAMELLLSGQQGIEVQGVVETADGCLKACASRCPDVVLLDVDLPDGSGIEAIARVKELCPDSQVLVVTAFQERQIVAVALAAGATGYLPKTRAAGELVEAVRRAASGEIVIPADQIAPLLAAVLERRKARSEEEWLLGQLTPREIDVLQAFAEGKSTAEVAQAFFISKFTVQSRVRSILSKLRVRSKLEAVTMALRHGLIRNQPV